MKRLVPRVIGMAVAASVLFIGSCGVVQPDRSAPIESATPIGTTVACVGDSITFGLGVSPSESYPYLLQQALGDKYEVANYGVSGATVNSSGDIPYVAQPEYQQALDSGAKIVLVMLGTNDAKSPNNTADSQATFQSQYSDLLQSFMAMPSHPVVYVLTPIEAVKGNDQIETTLAKLFRPEMRAVAAQLGLTVIELESVLGGNLSDYQDDGIHPTSAGYALISSAVYRALENK